ncbi:TetR/AcrR family transcriptional regulator C-terminal domain-containing protein [Rhodococcus sp. NPDC056743]|uniref:TetR/AcrR family transcriptional regulator C-terminal domain-containing protein n=1 Tax=Rhodococcus sp. NPDC056743 TaxID=3345934 RepID=UPI00366B6CA7
MLVSQVSLVRTRAVSLPACQAAYGCSVRAALDAWQEAGPRRAHRALAEAFERLARDGQLRTRDGRRAARHFIQLVGSEVEDRSEFGAVPLDDREVREAVTAGVDVFLHGYSPRG